MHPPTHSPETTPPHCSSLVGVCVNGYLLYRQGRYRLNFTSHSISARDHPGTRHRHTHHPATTRNQASRDCCTYMLSHGLTHKSTPAPPPSCSGLPCRGAWPAFRWISHNTLKHSTHTHAPLRLQRRVYVFANFHHVLHFRSGAMQWFSSLSTPP